MEHVPEFLVTTAIFLLAAVIAVPIFRRIRMGSVLGYLAAGSVIGPFGLGLIGDIESVLHLSEFGVVLLLFIIGLELKPQRLWALRRDIFGLGTAQILLTGALLCAAFSFLGLSWSTAIVAGLGLALSSTAFALQILEERGDLNTPYGTRSFAILLMQDMAIVPLLGLVAILGAGASGLETSWQEAGMIIAILIAFVVGGRFLLGPVLRLIAGSGSNEIFSAAALLLVVSAALVTGSVGLSMAMGGFLAGVLLAESEYRHQLEADILPFRGLLLGLFFMAVGMSIDWQIILANLYLVILGVLGLMLLKGGVLFGLCRAFGSGTVEASRIATTLPQGGEFAFVLFAAAVANGVVAVEAANLLTVIVTLSMAATPVIGAVYERALGRLAKAEFPDDLEGPEGAEPHRVIIGGFGRVGQIVAQILAARGISVTAIDNDPERIQIAKKYGSKVYFGDIRRPDVLAAAGADKADLIILCIHARQICNDTIMKIRSHYPNAQILTRAFDRHHVLELMEMDVDYFVRETFESSVMLGRESLVRLGVSEKAVDEIETDFRRRDREKLTIEQIEGEIVVERKKDEPSDVVIDA